ncbi:MAG: prohibitin family protein [Verrucomicrobiota bacterium]
MNQRPTDLYELNTFAPKIVAVIVVVVILGFLGTQAFHVVDPGTRGVSVTLGKVNPQFLPEGFSMKIPVIEKIYNISVKQITIPGEAVSFSSDLQTVKVAYNVLFRIPETQLVELFRKYSGSRAEDYYRYLIEPRVQESIKQVASQYKAENIVKNRPEVKSLAQESLVEAMESLMEIRDLVITNIDLTDELEAAIERKQVAEQEAQRKDYELQIAEKDAQIAIVKAEGEAKAIKIRGEALQASPEVIELQIAEKWDGKSPQTVVTGNGGANVLLPLR